MCGINGVIALYRNTKDLSYNKRADIESMNNTIVHRGPDAGGVFLEEPVALGFRRLSIIDLDASANQPMFNTEDNLVIVFNGEIYNYLEIREALIQKGYKFKTNSDTEVILNSYMEYGEECVQHFNGMWAFALYDRRKKRLFCSRDRLGVKPFYYSVLENHLYFSSELKAIHKVTGQNRANLKRVYEYLAYGYRINDGDTFFENCYELLPGTNLTIVKGELTSKKYWKLGKDLYEHSKQANHHQAFRNLFESAVKLRYRSDVPVALLLSGGLDSSAIARVTDDLIEEGKMPSTDIHAFIASFPGFEDDETHIAREFIKTCKHIKLHEIKMDSQSIVGNFEKLIYDFDHPLFSFNTVIHNDIMRECNKRGLKVVINGQGSDEALAGYDRYNSGAHLFDELLSNEGEFFKEFRALNRENGYSKLFLLGQMFKSVISPSKAAYLRSKFQEKTLDFLSDEFINANCGEVKSDYKFSKNGGNLESYLLDKINNQGLNAILHYEDVSSMNQSIEIRSPFMDYRLMEFSFSIPNKLKLKRGVTKRILRETIGKSLPDSITKNRNKIGFSTPFIEYLSEDDNFKTYLEEEIIASDNFKKKTIWDSEKLTEAMRNPSKHPNLPYWRIINLEIWSKVYGISNL